jgi:hypothetical protein
MTRQYKWQIRMVREGKCKICGVPAVTKLYCEKHRLAANARTYEAAHKRRYEAAQYVSANNAGKIFHFPKWLLAEPIVLHYHPQTRSFSCTLLKDEKTEVGFGKSVALAAKRSLRKTKKEPHYSSARPERLATDTAVN